MAGDVFWVGNWRVEPGLREVRLEGTAGRSVHKLEPKVMDVLVVLAREAGDVVTRESLQVEVWDGLHVTADALNRVISRLRKIFDDAPNAPRFIETIRQRGYRLVAPVNFGDDAGPSTTPTHQEPPAQELAERAVVAEAQARGQRPLGALVTGLLLVAASGVAGFYLVSTSDPATLAVEASLSEAVPVTSLPGEERDGALSPDGEFLAFQWNGGAGLPLDLYLKPMGSEDVQRLGDEGSRYGSPAWSPGGRRLAMVRRGKAPGVVLLDLDSGHSPTSLVQVGDEVDVRLDWSPDGRQLVFTDRPAEAVTTGVYLLDAETGHRKPLVTSGPQGASSRYPNFSSDGTSVVFARNYPSAADEICSVPVTGGRVEVQHRVPGSLEGLAVTPDGGLLYSVAHSQTAGELWWRPPGEGTARRLASSERFFDLRGTPRGEVLFARWTFDANIWSLDLAGLDSIAADGPVVGSSRWDSSPAVSSEDDLAFVSLRSGQPELWRSRPGGSGAVRLTSFGGPALGLPSWSPDGRHIAIQADLQIYLVDAWERQRIRPTTMGPVIHSAPSWSRDGRWLYVTAQEGDRWSILRMSIESGASERLTDGTSARESTDGTAVYFTRWQTPGLWYRSLASGAEEQLVDDLDPDDRHNWNLDATGIYYVASADGRRDIVFLNLATGRKTRLGDATLTPYAGGLAVTPDRSALLFVRVDRSESDLMMARLVMASDTGR